MQDLVVPHLGQTKFHFCGQKLVAVWSKTQQDVARTQLNAFAEIKVQSDPSPIASSSHVAPAESCFECVKMSCSHVQELVGFLLSATKFRSKQAKSSLSPVWEQVGPRIGHMVSGGECVNAPAKTSLSQGRSISFLK